MPGYDYISSEVYSLYNFIYPSSLCNSCFLRYISLALFLNSIIFTNITYYLFLNPNYLPIVEYNECISSKWFYIFSTTWIFFHITLDALRICIKTPFGCCSTHSNVSNPLGETSVISWIFILPPLHYLGVTAAWVPVYCYFLLLLMTNCYGW